HPANWGPAPRNRVFGPLAYALVAATGAPARGAVTVAHMRRRNNPCAPSSRHLKSAFPLQGINISAVLRMAIDRITVRAARQHNLKNISLEIPRNRLTVITGLSGCEGFPG